MSEIIIYGVDSLSQPKALLVNDDGSLPIAGGAGTFKAGVSTLGNTQGNTGTVSNQLVLAGGANVTLSQSTGAGGATVTISGAAGGAGGLFSAGASTIGNTLGSTGTVSNQLVLAGINRITLSQSTDAGGATLSISGPSAATGISGVAASNTTYTSGTLTITGVGGGVTVSSNTGQRVDISVAAPVAQSVQTQNLVALSATNTLYTSGTVTLTGSNMVTVKSSAAGQAIIVDATQSVQTQNMVAISASNTLYTSGTVTITGSNMVTVKSGAAQGVVIDATQSVQTQNLVDVTVSGNSTSAGAGYALVSSGTLTLAGGPNITLSQDGNKISISGGAGAGGATFSAGVSTGGNTQGNTGTVSNQVVFVGSNNITLSQATAAGGATVTIKDAVSATRSVHVPYPEYATNSRSMGSGKFFVQPLMLQGNLTATRLGFRVSHAGTSASSFAITFSAALCSLVNSTSLGTASSGSQSYSYTSNAAGSTDYTGLRIVTVPLNVNATDADWFLALYMSSAGGATIGLALGHQMVTNTGNFGQAGATTIAQAPWQGSLSMTTNAMPSGFARSAIDGQGGNAPYLPAYIILTNVD